MWTGPVLVAIFVSGEDVQVTVFSWIICCSALQNHHPVDTQTGELTTLSTADQVENSQVSPVRTQQMEHPADIIDFLSNLQKEDWFSHTAAKWPDVCRTFIYLIRFEAPPLHAMSPESQNTVL